MKKLMLVIALFLISLFSVQYMSGSVYAAECTADKNVYIQSFASVRSGVDAALGVKQESSVSTITVLVSSILEVLNITLAGSAGNCVEDSIEVAMLDRNYSPGAMHYGLGAMASVFINSPSSSIPGHYAQMLLPKELVSGGSAYAAVGCSNVGFLTSSPECMSASEYWSIIGISQLWQLSFTLAMIFVVLVLIISGFMIMFRSKIGGQVVVTVSMALQNVVLATGMALASFALGVFFLNLSKFLMLIFANIFLAVVANSGLNLVTKLYYEVAGVTFFNEPFGLSAKLLLTLLLGDAGNLITEVITNFGFGNPSGLVSTLGSLFGETVQFIAGMATNAMVLGTGGGLFLLSRIIITGGIFIASIRIFWTALKIYIKMVIDVVSAPVLFVLMAIPGKNTGISDWIFRMFKNALAPPVMFLAINMIVLLTLQLAFGIAKTSIEDGGPIPAISGGALSNGTFISTFFSMQSLGMGLHGLIMMVLLHMVPSIPKAMEDLFASKASGSMQKAGEEVSKRLQSIPMLGALMK